MFFFKLQFVHFITPSKYINSNLDFFFFNMCRTNSSTLTFSFTVLHFSETCQDFFLYTTYNQGCQAGSMRHRLSRLLAAATSVFTLLSPPSNWAKL